MAVLLQMRRRNKRCIRRIGLHKKNNPQFPLLPLSSLKGASEPRPDLRTSKPAAGGSFTLTRRTFTFDPWPNPPNRTDCASNKRQKRGEKLPKTTEISQSRSFRLAGGRTWPAHPSTCPAVQAPTTSITFTCSSGTRPVWLPGRGPTNPPTNKHTNQPNNHHQTLIVVPPTPLPPSSLPTRAEK